MGAGTRRVLLHTFRHMITTDGGYVELAPLKCHHLVWIDSLHESLFRQLRKVMAA